MVLCTLHIPSPLIFANVLSYFHFTDGEAETSRGNLPKITEVILVKSLARMQGSCLLNQPRGWEDRDRREVGMGGTQAPPLRSSIMYLSACLAFQGLGRYWLCCITLPSTIRWLPVPPSGMEPPTCSAACCPGLIWGSRSGKGQSVLSHPR